jgi:WD40 repeat protein
MYVVGLHDRGVSQVAFSPDGEMLASLGGGDQLIKLWDPRRPLVPDESSNKALFVLEGHDGPVNTVAVTRDGKRIVSGGADGYLRVWDGLRGTELHRCNADLGSVHHVGLLDDGERVMSTYGSDVVVIWRLQDGGELKRLSTGQGRITAIAIDDSGTLLATGGADGSIKTWKWDGAPQVQFVGHEGEITAVLFMPDGQHVASAGSDRKVLVWRRDAQQPLVSLGEGKYVYDQLVCRPDGQRLLCGTRGRLDVFDIKTWKPNPAPWGLSVQQSVCRSIHDRRGEHRLQRSG